jgi:hypothetical protein
LAEELEGRVAFIGVSNNDTVAAGKEYAEKFDVPYPLAHAPAVWEEFDVPYQPVTIVLDSRLKISSRVDGPITSEGLEQMIAEVL